MQDGKRRDNDEAETRSISKTSAKPRLPELERLGTFHIEEIIDAGGMGTVFRAFDESMKRTVALKVLHPSLEFSPSVQSRFAREAWIAGQLEHPHIIKVYSRGEETGFKYIAMEYADGGSLADYIRQVRQTVPNGADISDTARSDYIGDILWRFIELSEALEYIHAKGFIHRDIKPQNILLSGKQRQFKFADFGIAHAEDMTKITKAGDFIGTVKYMSPELLTAHRAKVDKRTDIYSFGVTLYEAVTLTLPFESNSEEGLIGEILSGHAIPARRRNKCITRDLETVLLKCTHHDPDRRYPTSADLADDLRRIAESRPIAAKREGLPTRAYKFIRRNRASFGATAAGIVLTVFLAFAYITWRANEERLAIITETLENALLTRTSPFALNARWPELSNMLLKRIRDGVVDSTTILFFKVNHLCDYDYQEYSLFEKTKLMVSYLGLGVFQDKNRIPDSSDYFVASFTEVDVTLDDGVFKRIDVIAAHYGRMSPHGLTIGELFHRLFDTVSYGKNLVQVRRITSHYLNAGLYEIYRDRFSEFLENLVINAAGDSLVVLFGTCNYRPQILIEVDLTPAEPVYVDTAIDSLYLLIWDSYPTDFPKMISGKSNAGKGLVVSEVSVSRYDSARYGTLFSGLILKDSLIVPIAADFIIEDKSRNMILLTGKIRLDTKENFDISYGTTTDGSGYYERGINRTRVLRNSTDITCGELSFDELIDMGAVDARLTLLPSIDVARFFGDVYEFSGDTLVFHIKFQAVDEWKTE